MYYITATVLAAICYLAPIARASPAVELRRCAASAPDPPVQVVLTAVLRRARLGGYRGDRWSKRLRWAALLPRLSAHVHQAWGRAEYIDLRPDAPDQLDANYRLATRWQLQATWNLDRLAFDRNVLAAARTAQRLEARRQQIIQRVTRLYFERQTLRRALAADDDPPMDDISRVCSITAELEALADRRLFR